MVARRVTPGGDESKSRIRSNARTLEARENQVVALAFDLVEKRIREGTATSQEVTHFLKIGSTREQAERERLRLETELTRAKTEALSKSSDFEKVVQNAVEAMKSYQGIDNGPAYDD